MDTTSKYLALGVGSIEFDFNFDEISENNTNKIVALKRKDGDPIVFNKAFVEAISEELATLVPEGINLKLHSGLIAIGEREHETEARRIFAVKFGGDFTLSKLPLVGKYFSEGQSLGIADIQLTVSSVSWNEEETTRLTQITPRDTVQLPSYITEGPNFNFALLIGGTKQQIVLETVDNTNNPGSGPVSGVNIPRPPTQPGMTIWIPMNKTLGPVHIKRIGFRYHESVIHMMLDAGITKGPLKFFLQGLSVGSPVEDFKPEFNLDGLGLSYAKPGLEIAGGLLRNTLDESYNGTVIVKTKTMSITALGAYKKFEGMPSVFVYGLAENAVGVGPPGFQITGMTLGFGYNRSVKIPKLSRLSRFPLVSAALGTGQEMGTDPMEVLGYIKEYIPADPGALFMAWGLKFNNFKVINSFALLLVQLNRRLQVDILGMSRLSLPLETPTKPTVFVEIGWKARYDFDEGAIKVDGTITDTSYIFSRNCKLYGEMAFYQWLEGSKAGDFVFTIGGYHPRFKAPAHYPQKRRLGFQWEIFRGKLQAGDLFQGETNLVASGNMYWAKTPMAQMMGGRIETLFTFEMETGFEVELFGFDLFSVTLSGKVEASFTIEADFIISLRPFYYETTGRLSVGISATFKGEGSFLGVTESVEESFDLSLGADFRLWGPEFSGTVSVDWDIISFDIPIGTSERPNPQPLSWDTFKSAFLPPSADVTGIVLEDGGLRQLENENGEEIWVVNSAELLFSVHSEIPAKDALLGKNGSNDQQRFQTGGAASFGIAPVNIAAVSAATQYIEVLDTDNNNADISGKFQWEPIYKNAPKALWGSSFKPPGIGEMNQQDGLIKDTLAGFRLRPKPKIRPDQTEARQISDFSYDIESRENAYTWQEALGFNDHHAEDDTARRTEIQRIGQQFGARNGILEDLKSLELIGHTGVNLNGLENNTFDAFLTAPQVLSMQPS